MLGIGWLGELTLFFLSIWDLILELGQLIPSGEKKKQHSLFSLFFNPVSQSLQNPPIPINFARPWLSSFEKKNISSHPISSTSNENPTP